MRRGTWIHGGLLALLATMSLGAGSAAAADDCHVRFEPVPGRVGERATLIATGFTPNGTGVVDEAAEKTGPLPNELQFDANGEARVNFVVGPEMAGRRVFDLTDDTSDCVAGRIWFVEPAPPDTSTDGGTSQPTHSFWPAALVFLVSLRLFAIRFRSHPIR